jgi:hypothetical protein
VITKSVRSEFREPESPENSRQDDAGRLWWLALLGLSILPSIVLWQFRNVEFLADDVFFGPGFSVLSQKELWLGAWPHTMGLTKAWRPLSELTYVVQASLSTSASSYHLFNYLLHGLNAAMLAVVVRAVTKQSLAGFLAGALFALHPVVHENVQWISGRTYPLAGAFALALSVWSINGDRRPWILQHVVGVTLLIGALASYEFSIVAPLASLSVAYVVWRDRQPTVRLPIVSFVIPYAVTIVGYFAFRWLFLTSFNADVVVAARASQWLPIGPITYRVPTNATFATLRLMAWPWFEQWSGIHFGLTGLFTTAVVVISAVVLLRSPERRTVGATWLFWSLLFYLPISAAAAFTDRFAYMSAAGVAALIATAAAWLYERGSLLKRCVVLGVAASLALCWAAELTAHANDWRNAGRISTKLLGQLRAAERAPQSPVSLYFIDLPVRYRSAILFLTYFPSSVLQTYPAASRSYIHIVISTSPEDAVVAEARNSSFRRVAVYRWDARSEHLGLVWSRSDTSSGLYQQNQ